MSILGKSYNLNFNGKTLKVYINPLVARSLSSVWIQQENTTVLVTLNVKKENKFLGFLPLTVDYEEKFYSIGKILGSKFLRREGRPSESAILNARLIDRSLRPRFDKFFFWPTHITVTVFSFDYKNDPDLLGLFGASLALCLSPLPFDGPLAGVRIGILQGEKIVEPSFDISSSLDGEIIFAGDGNLVDMIEVKAKEIDESYLIDSFQIANENIKKLIDFQNEIIEDLKSKPEYEFLNKKQQISFNFSVPLKIEEIVNRSLKIIEKDFGKESPGEYELDKSFTQELSEEEKSLADFLFKEKIKEEFVNYIFSKGKRPDGRDLNQIRNIEVETSVIPRVHGSAYFGRGLTKVMSFVTLDSIQQELLVKEIEFIGGKRFMHHYNFPPYCTGEVGSIKGPMRREIGHSALVEKALLPLVPDLETFPYAIRVVSEVLSSNGSTSMASVCASSLALLDAGVPLKRNVAGISIGLVSKGNIENKNNWLTLVDIQGIEDHYGDMDFKVAGTNVGITALQMDVKIKGITLEILKDALEKAKKARLEILEKMNSVKSTPNKISEHAPKIQRTKIDPEKIGLLIGTGGRTINQIAQETNSEIFIDTEENYVYVICENEENLQKAMEKVKKIIAPREYDVGDVAQGTVIKFFDFGVLVELEGGINALLHISNMENEMKNKKNFGLQLGQKISVKIKEKDKLGRLSLVLV